MNKSTINPIFVFIWKNRLLNLAISFVLGILLIIYVFFVMEKQYTASASILPPASSLSGAMGGNLGALANLAGLGSMSSGFQNLEMYRSIISSRTLQTRLLHTKFSFEHDGEQFRGKFIKFLDIEGETKRQIYEKAYEALNQDVLYADIGIDSELLIVNVTVKYPELAALVANETIEYLDEIVQKQLTVEYHEKSEYLQNRIKVVSDSLKMAENDLIEFLENTRDLEAPANIIKEMELRRAITVQTTIYGELKKQEEIFVLENMFNLSPVKVLDYAQPPYRKSRPKRLLVLLSFFFVFSFIQFIINTSIVIYRRFKTNVINRIDE